MRLIDVDALIAYIKKRIRNEMVIAWLCRIIGEVPTIETEPEIHATWQLMVYNETPFSEDQCLVCTACGFAHEHDAWFNRCPHCGAKMDKEERK